MGLDLVSTDFLVTDFRHKKKKLIFSNASLSLNNRSEPNLTNT